MTEPVIRAQYRCKLGRRAATVSRKARYRVSNGPEPSRSWLLSTLSMTPSSIFSSTDTAATRCVIQCNPRRHFENYRLNRRQSLVRNTVGNLIPLFRMFVKCDNGRTDVGGRKRRWKLLHKVFKGLARHFGVCACGCCTKFGMRTHRGDQAVKPYRAPGLSRKLPGVLGHECIHLLRS